MHFLFFYFRFNFSFFFSWFFQEVLDKWIEESKQYILLERQNDVIFPNTNITFSERLS